MPFVRKSTVSHFKGFRFFLQLTWNILRCYPEMSDPMILTQLITAASKVDKRKGRQVT